MCACLYEKAPLSSTMNDTCLKAPLRIYVSYSCKSHKTIPKTVFIQVRFEDCGIPKQESWLR